MMENANSVVMDTMLKKEFVLKTTKIVRNMPGSIVRVIGINHGLQRDPKLVNAVRRDIIQTFTTFV